MERLRNAGGHYDGPSGCSWCEGGAGGLNVVLWEYIELRGDVVDRPMACASMAYAFSGDTRQKVKPAACRLPPHPPCRSSPGSDAGRS